MHGVHGDVVLGRAQVHGRPIHRPGLCVRGGPLARRRDLHHGPDGGQHGLPEDLEPLAKPWRETLDYLLDCLAGDVDELRPRLATGRVRVQGRLLSPPLVHGHPQAGLAKIGGCVDGLALHRADLHRGLTLQTLAASLLPPPPLNDPCSPLLGDVPTQKLQRGLLQHDGVKDGVARVVDTVKSFHRWLLLQVHAGRLHFGLSPAVQDLALHDVSRGLRHLLPLLQNLLADVVQSGIPVAWNLEALYAFLQVLQLVAKEAVTLEEALVPCKPNGARKQQVHLLIPLAHAEEHVAP
mmetsp:Transcript_42364/g.134613  ORF Transcript_42364/g.134613 Transcript_42364/m.134613 type:complete len:294 (-) Transcript_42364:1706-2587(-)